MKLSRATWALTLAAAVALGVGARIAVDREPDDLTAEWKPLLERCRTAIEQARPLDVAGLQPLELSRADRLEFVGSRQRWRAFAMPRGAFALIESEAGDANYARRACDIIRRPGLRPLTAQQLAFLHYSYSREMDARLLEGTHGFRGPGAFPFLMTMFGAVKNNPNGCQTVIMMRSTPYDRMPEHPPSFVTTVAEQTFKPCGSPSRLDEEMRQKL